MASFWVAFGLSFGSLWVLLASFGPPLGSLWRLFWNFSKPSRAFSAPWTYPGRFLVPFGSLWVLLASFGAHLGSLPCLAFSPPWTDLGSVFPYVGSFLGLLVITLGWFWGLFGIPWLSFWASSCQLNLLVFARLSPDECWRVPAESKRILRNRFVIIGTYRHLIFSKVSNSRLPQQAESKKQGGRRCVARRASSIMEGYENQFRQRIAAEIKGSGQELPGGI